QEYTEELRRITNKGVSIERGRGRVRGRNRGRGNERSKGRGENKKQNSVLNSALSPLELPIYNLIQNHYLLHRGYLMVENTNTYEQLKGREGGHVWSLLTLNELKTWLGLIIYMGVHQINTVEELWNWDEKKANHEIKSIPLFKYLCENGIGACSTIYTNLAGFLKELKISKEMVLDWNTLIEK
ncbi:4511_t:CDS:2, partial [Cetraspora pellucida]